MDIEEVHWVETSGNCSDHRAADFICRFDTGAEVLEIFLTCRSVGVNHIRISADLEDYHIVFFQCRPEFVQFGIFHRDPWFGACHNACISLFLDLSHRLIEAFIFVIPQRSADTD